jgi:hypothetical protein
LEHFLTSLARHLLAFLVGFGPHFLSAFSWQQSLFLSIFTQTLPHLGCLASFLHLRWHLLTYLLLQRAAPLLAEIPHLLTALAVQWHPLFTALHMLCNL